MRSRVLVVAISLVTLAAPAIATSAGAYGQAFAIIKN